MIKTIVGLTLLLPTLVCAVSLKNDITGVGPNGSIKPIICLQTPQRVLAPGQTVDVTPESGDGKIGGSLRFNGCSSQDSYLGYVEFIINKSGNNTLYQYIPPKGVHIAFQNPSISSDGVISGAIKYTLIEPNFNLSPASETPNWEFAGINLSGLEFGKVIDPFVIPNLSEIDGSIAESDLRDTEAFIQKGVNTVRVPISWGYIQLDGAGIGKLNEDYYTNYVHPLLQTLTHAKVHTILDLHAYMRYSTFGEQYSGCSGAGPCPDGKLIVDEKAYESVWGQLWERMRNDPTIDKQYLLLDLVNEPVDAPDDKVFTIQASLIKMLRNKQFPGYILVEGNAWTGLHSWASHQWTGSDGQTYTNASLFTRANFAKAGITDLSKILINVHQYLDNDYSGTHQTCQQDLNTLGSNGFNLQAFTNYLQENQLKAIVTEFGTGEDSSSCAAPLREFMHYLQDNSSLNKDYGFAGWTIWSTGHGWGNYNLRVKPESYQMAILEESLR